MITVTCCIAGWLLGWLLLGRPHRVAAGRDPAEKALGRAPDIVIPARDEAEVIGALLSDLAAHPDAVGRIVVVDDHSGDATAEVASAFDGVDVVHAPDLPEGWNGKPWACHQGVLALQVANATNPQPLHEVEGEVEGSPPLVFLDADVRLPNGALALRPILAARGRYGGLVSVQPWHDTARPYEQLSAVFNLVAIMGAGLGARGGASAAFGPVLATTVEDYHLAGGHDGVRGEVVEDLALARNYRRAGLQVAVFEGGRDIRFRMYPDGPTQLFEGWTKNFASGAGATPPWRLAGIVLWIAGLGSAVVALVGAARGDLPWWVAIGLYTASAVQIRVMSARVGRFGTVSALLYPVLLAVFVGVFLRSLWSTVVRRRVTWRGREIPIDARRR